MSIREALTEYFDITTPLSQEALKTLASQALNEKDRINLETLGTVKLQKKSKVFFQNLYYLFKDWKAYEIFRAEYPNLVDVLKTYFSVNPDINTLLSVLSHMKSRFYSISSAKNKTNNELDITLGVYKNESNVYNSLHYGVCSKYLEQAPIGSLIPGEIIQ